VISNSQSVGRGLPAYAWAGLLVMIVSEAAMLRRIEPFWSWHTPIAWTGYLLFVDGWIWKRRGQSWLQNAPAEFAFLACASVPLWLVFELYNKFTLHNWYYVGLPENLLLRYFGYAWSFATISPAMFVTAELIASLRDRRAPEWRRARRVPVPLGTLGWISIAIGVFMLVLPILYPSPWLAAPVWLGFIFLLDPLNAASRDEASESIRGDFAAGHRARFVNLLAAGLVCGVIWEFWNYWSRTKWIYVVPVPPNIKIFEMPIAGYGGFPAFAIECFVMYVFVRRWIWRGAWRPISL
jgi:hypothetical protein